MLSHRGSQCKRAKLRGSPKALVTKEVEETLPLAPLMTGGMVTSLMISAMKWVIADLNQTIPSVKEQRVDGSSVPYVKTANLKRSRLNYIYLGTVRCTFAAGKPVFGRKLNSFCYNCKFVRVLFHSSSIAQNSIAHKLTALVKPLHLIKSLDP